MFWPYEKEKCGRSSEELINILEGKRGRGRPKKSLDGVLREDVRVVGVSEDVAYYRRRWRDKIRILERREVAL